MTGVTIKLSRSKGMAPKPTMLKFDEFSWNIADGILYGKGLDDTGNEVIIKIGGGSTAQNEHQRRHVVINPQDHAPAQEEDFGKVLRAHPLTGHWILDDAADKHLVYAINHSTEIVIQHSLGKQPAVQIRDIGGELCLTDITHIDNSHTRIVFREPFSGFAIFN